MRVMGLQGEGVRDMQDPEGGRLTACEWHEEYPEDDCLPCKQAWDWYQEHLHDLQGDR